MSYYLRIEAVNLGNFVMDTNNLPTIRGGSLLLLESINQVEKILPQAPSIDIKTLITNNLQAINKTKQELKKLKGKEKTEKKKELDNLKKEKNDLKKHQKNTSNNTDVNQSPTITKGASWGLFDLGDIEESSALKIKKDAIDFFNKDENHKYATFMVDVYQSEIGEAYPVSRSKVQTLNRWQQLQSPTLSILKANKAVCDIDHVSPTDLSDYNKDGKKIDISPSIKQRRDYGIEEKKTASFYKKRIDNEIPIPQLTNDLKTLSQNPPDYASNLKGKIAFIYIDGNKFGKAQKDSTNPEDQKRFDQKTRKGRNQLLSEIIQKIKDQIDWLTKQQELKLETLLWGGDEIIWVVPAWQGWWILNEFYKLAKQHIYLDQEGDLFHGSSIVFCHHNAPIYRIDKLARSLADDYSKIDDFKKENMISYQVLESFDHIGSDLEVHRQDQIKGLTKNIDELLIDANNISRLSECILNLKNNDFPRRKIYQIVQAYRHDNTEKADKLYSKLTGTNSSNPQTKEQESYKKQLEKLQNCFNTDENNLTQIHWLHLMELWDYVGLKQNGEED